MAKKDTDQSKFRSAVILLVIFIIGVFGITIVWMLTPRMDLRTGPLKDEGAVTIGGKAICLPHRDTSGPQTDECAYGLKADDGYYYALRDTDSQYKNISTMPMNEHVTITGTFKKASDKKYPTIGVIEISKVEK